MQFIIAGFQGIFNEPIILVYLIFGIFLGMVMGAIPGLTASLAVTLMLPFTYSMTHTAGISLLVALYVGGISGGLISAILLNIPGTPSSLVTCFDGGPMAKNGKAGLALSLGVFASFVGGIGQRGRTDLHFPSNGKARAAVRHMGVRRNGHFRSLHRCQPDR